MSAHNRAVDHGVLGVGVGRQVLEHPLPHAGLGPAAEAGLHLDPAAEPLGQVAPGNARAVAVKHGLDKQPVVLGRAPDMSDPARQKVSDPRPFVITQAVASHQSGPHYLTVSSRSCPAPEAPKSGHALALQKLWGGRRDVASSSLETTDGAPHATAE